MKTTSDETKTESQVYLCFVRRLNTVYFVQTSGKINQITSMFFWTEVMLMKMAWEGGWGAGGGGGIEGKGGEGDPNSFSFSSYFFNKFANSFSIFSLKRKQRKKKCQMSQTSPFAYL